MADQEFPGFDRTVQETHAWLREISDEMGDSRRSIAYHALRGVLFALRDRLGVDEVFDLSSQLPMLIRGIYFEGYKPAGKPETATRAVLAVLQRHVSPGEIADLQRALPKDLRDLWPEVIVG